jgi:hypothetical protein
MVLTSGAIPLAAEKYVSGSWPVAVLGLPDPGEDSRGGFRFAPPVNRNYD